MQLIIFSIRHYLNISNFPPPCVSSFLLQQLLSFYSLFTLFHVSSIIIPLKFSEFPGVLFLFLVYLLLHPSPSTHRHLHREGSRNGPSMPFNFLVPPDLPSSLLLFLCSHPFILCSLGKAVIMVERMWEVGWRDYCLVGSQKNRSAQKYVVRERGSVSDIINTLETYSENACVHSSAHEHTCAPSNIIPIWLARGESFETLFYLYKYVDLKHFIMYFKSTPDSLLMLKSSDYTASALFYCGTCVKFHSNLVSSLDVIGQVI